VRVEISPQPETDETQRAAALDLRIALFTIAGSTLYVALQQSPTGLALPRGLPESRESLDAAARRTVRAATHLQEQYLEQLYTFSPPGDDEPRVIVVSYLALICSGAAPDQTDGVAWTPAPVEVPLSDSDSMVVEYALLRLRAKLGYTNIAFHLLPETFTLTELQSAYETILGRRLDKRNFRRRMIASRILTETSKKRREGSHRPATLYRFQSEHDQATYLTPTWAAEQ
jgi:8-oxo-dGTP diphosphatase